MARSPAQVRQTPLEQLTAMNEEAGKRRKKSARPRDPTAKIERFYRARLRRLVSEMNRRVREEVLPVVRGEKAEYQVKDEDAAAARVEAAAARVEAAAQKTDLDPTEAEARAGTYRKGRVSLHGLVVTIENPRGSVRRGRDESGVEWERVMPHHYGYVNRSPGADGDQLDVFIGPDPSSEEVFVVDQVDPRAGGFDEHKVLLGFRSEEEARRGYLDAYEPGWRGLGGIRRLRMGQLHNWLRQGLHREPVRAHGVADAVPVVTSDAWADRVIETLERVSRELTEGAFASQFDRLAQQTVSMAEAETTEAFLKSVNQAAGVDMSAMLDQEGLQEYVQSAAYQNSRLIKNLANDYLSGVETAVLGGVRGGDAPSRIAEQIQKKTGVQRRKAELIARDQTSKLTGEITERRQQQAGIRYFRWVTSKDERVGDDHCRAAKRDVGYGPGIYRWDSPPPEGVPGNASRPNCRCTATPVFPWELPSGSS